MHCFGAKYKQLRWADTWHISSCIADACNPELAVPGGIHLAPQQLGEGERDESWGELWGWLLRGQVDCLGLFIFKFAWSLKIDTETTIILFSAWSPSARKYVCEICVVEVPCYDTLVKHKRGKEHIKREKDLEAWLNKYLHNLAFISGEKKEGWSWWPCLGRVQEASGSGTI